MKLENFKILLNRVKNMPYFTIAGETSKDQIEEAQKILGLKFSQQHSYFLKKYGTLSFSGYEFFGICKAGLSAQIVPCSIGLTIRYRDRHDLKANYVLLGYLDEGYSCYFDYSSLNQDGEPKIVVLSSLPKETVFINTIANDLGDYIEKCIKESI